MTGSVYQRQSDGRWVASVRVNGKKLVRYAPTERKARAKLAKLHQELGLGRLSPPTKLTLEAWIEDWLREKSLRASTRQTYTRILRDWSRELGRVPLSRLSAPALRAVLLSWQEKGMGSRSREQHWTYLHGCLQGAVDLGILPLDPLSQVKKPRHTTPKPDLWSPEQALAFLNHALRSPRSHSDLPAFLLLTGLRLGEALALTPQQLQGDQIRIEQALVWSSGRHAWEAPKTEMGLRTLTLHPLAQLLLTLHQHGPAERFFQTKTGSPPRPANLSRLMTHLCSEAQVPRIELRALRRVHSALLVDGGLDIKALQRHLGHSRAELSLNVYAYWARQRDDHARALDRSLGLR